MANTQGSGENPLVIDDTERSTWVSNPTKGGIVGYVDLDDEDKPTEKSIYEIPAGSRTASHRKNQRERKSTRRSPGSERRQSSGSMVGNSPRLPPRRPCKSAVIDLTVSDDDGGEVERHYAPRRSEADDGSDEAKAVLPSAEGLKSVVSNIGPPTQRSSYPPIGGRADSGREQTTPRRVEANAPVNNDGNESGKLSTIPQSLERTNKSGQHDVPPLRIKARAVKSATSPPKRKPVSERSAHRPARNHAQSPSSTFEEDSDMGAQISGPDVQTYTHIEPENSLLGFQALHEGAILNPSQLLQAEAEYMARTSLVYTGDDDEQGKLTL
jgi:hypothetical protein